MEDSEKDKIKQKWATILGSMGVTGSKEDWLAEYSQNMASGGPVSSSTDNFPSMLPVAMKLAARTIGNDLVSVSPLPGPGISSTKLKEIEAEIKQENRDGKIDSLIDEKDYVEKKVEDHPDWVSGPGIGLLYLDFKYDSSTQSDI